MSQYSFEYLHSGERHIIYVHKDGQKVCEFFGDDSAMVSMNLYAGLKLLASTQVISQKDAREIWEQFDATFD
jgi:hypothetical protein